MHARLRNATLSALTLALACALTACGGGGGSGSGAPAAIPVTPSTPTPTPAPTPAPPPSQTQSTVVVGASGGSATLAAISNGVAAGIAFSGPASGAGATVKAALSVANPEAVPPSSMRRAPRSIGASPVNPIAYVALSSNAALSFAQSPALTFTVPAGVWAPNGYWIAFFDPANGNGWTVIGGAGAVSGTTVTFAGAAGGLSFAANVQYAIVLFVPGGTFPSPTPSPTPTATPAVTPSPAPSTSATPVAQGSTPPCTDASARGSLASRRAPRANGGVVPDRLYVVTRAGARSVESITRGVATARTAAVASYNGKTYTAVTLAPGTNAPAAAAALRANGALEVGSLHYRSLAGCNSAANDPLNDSSRQWYLLRENAPAAWAVTHGAGISIAVIDTGADETNPDLSAKIDVKEKVLNGVITGGNGSVQDSDGHGTDTAGLAAAQTDNAYGFASIGWDVRLQIYKIFPETTTTDQNPSADTADEAQAVTDAVANGASVISLSLGSPQNGGADAVEQAAIESAIQAGVVVVAAAGNEFPKTGSDVPDYPAGYPGVIAVGASSVSDTAANTYSTITADTVASYSNSGPALLAPGGDPASNDGDRLHWVEGYTTSTPGLTADQCSGTVNGFPACAALWAGTSMATPQVAATVALMMAKHGGPRSVSPATASQILTSTADSLGSLIPALRQGAGRLNVANALAHS